MPRPLYLVILAMAAAALLASCRGASTPEDARLRVVATIAPVGALAQAVAGDAVRLDVIAKAGVDPHEYQLKTADARAIANAQLILRNGLGADAFLDKALGNSKGTVVTITDGLTLRDGASGDGGSGHDPHVWHDPHNDIAMVEVIVKALATADPAHAATFEANGRAYQERLRQTDREVQALIEGIPPANRKMVTDHDAFGYFAARYGLTVVGTVIAGVTTGSEPSAASVAALVQTIRREGVRAVFAESSVDPKIARRVAEETNVRIVDDLYGDSLGAPGSGADTIEGMLLSNARKIADALK
ncbi:MAG: zinc ABC transporter substrate-binding protein [Dehalococcoidia bacterium]|nr:MAG: zinc ABC transporter substrate-binding protein [Dehalococcoidia bacterium]